VASNKRKTREQKRESKLCERVATRCFVATWGFLDRGYGIFFAISAKSAPPVLRNRIKRVFRDMAVKNIIPLLGEVDKERFSLCLISKKGVKFSGFDPCLREELEKITFNIVRKIG
jgi:hypothetical protein